MKLSHSAMSRRELLMKCAAMGCLTSVPSLALADALESLTEPSPQPKLKPTPPNITGPFYKRLAPHKAILCSPGDPGLPVKVSGHVLDVQGQVLQGAQLEIWQADHLGHYDLDGYRYRATLEAGGAGIYAFETVMPGHYPGRVCQHIHYRVTAPGHKPLVTQLYFATDPVFDGDPDRNFNRDPYVQNRELVRPVVLAGDPKAIHAEVAFELVMEPL